MVPRSSIDLIRALSPEGAERLERQLGWVNPIPLSASEVLDRLQHAIKRSANITHRTGEGSGETAELGYLKWDIEAMGVKRGA